MTEKLKIFSRFRPMKEVASFGDGNKGYILGIEKVGNSFSQAIYDVYFVDALKFILLIVAQICDKCNEVRFRSDNCTITSLKDGKEILTV